MKKKTIMAWSTTALLTLSALTMQSSMPADDVISKENGMDVVNTTSLTKKVRGYVGTTPVKIYIKHNKVVKVVALKNQETPKYFAKVKKSLLDKWNGKRVKAAAKMKVDGVTGATFSSDAVIKNVQQGLAYYQRKR